MNYLLNLKEKTIIFIAHHLPIAKACDQILVLHEGHLVEKGTHDELRFADGIYQNYGKSRRGKQFMQNNNWFEHSSIYTKQHHSFYRWVLYPVILFMYYWIVFNLC